MMLVFPASTPRGAGTGIWRSRVLGWLLCPFGRLRWAEAHGITAARTARYEVTLIFYEGCLIYVEDPNRGADQE
jgi:hypothetical protein